MSVTSSNPYAPGRGGGRRPAVPLVVAALIGATACAPPHPLSDGRSLKQFHEVPSRATWAADADRLEHELPTAVERTEWAVIRCDATPAALVDDRPEAAGRIACRIRALHPDGRTALIHAWHETAETVTMVVRVGRFGDAVEEASLIESLKQTLARPRPIPRRKNFELPDIPVREP